MPSHIFTRVGYWTESIASNAKSAEVAKDSKEFHDQLHAMDYLVYAHLQLSQEEKAKAAPKASTKDAAPAKAAAKKAAPAAKKTEKK